MAKNKGSTEAKPGDLVKFRFSKIWSGDRGAFYPGDEADLPNEIAESLFLEDMGEIVTAPVVAEETA